MQATLQGPSLHSKAGIKGPSLPTRFSSSLELRVQGLGRGESLHSSLRLYSGFLYVGFRVIGVGLLIIQGPYAYLDPSQLRAEAWLDGRLVWEGRVTQGRRGGKSLLTESPA